MVLMSVQIGGCDFEEGTPFKGDLLGGTFQDCVTVCGPLCFFLLRTERPVADSERFSKRTPRVHQCSPKAKSLTRV